MSAREINPFTARTRIRSQFIRTQWSTSNHQRVDTTTPQTAQPSGRTSKWRGNWCFCIKSSFIRIYLHIFLHHYSFKYSLRGLGVRHWTTEHKVMGSSLDSDFILVWDAHHQTGSGQNIQSINIWFFTFLLHQCMFIIKIHILSLQQYV